MNDADNAAQQDDPRVEDHQVNRLPELQSDSESDPDDMIINEDPPREGDPQPNVNHSLREDADPSFEN